MQNRSCFCLECKCVCVCVYSCHKSLTGVITYWPILTGVVLSPAGLFYLLVFACFVSFLAGPVLVSKDVY